MNSLAHAKRAERLMAIGTNLIVIELKPAIREIYRYVRKVAETVPVNILRSLLMTWAERCAARESANKRSEGSRGIGARWHPHDSPPATNRWPLNMARHPSVRREKFSTPPFGQNLNILNAVALRIEAYARHDATMNGDYTVQYGGAGRGIRCARLSGHFALQLSSLNASKKLRPSPPCRKVPVAA